MNLSKMAIPDPLSFFILLSNGDKVGIVNYNSININFCERIIFKDGNKVKINVPLVTYNVTLSKEAKNKVRTLFVNSDFHNQKCIQAIRAAIEINNMRYSVDLEAIPCSVNNSYMGELKDYVKVHLRLESTSIEIFDTPEEVLEVFSRFDILDL